MPFVQFAQDIPLRTPGEVTLLDVTEEVAAVVRASGVRLGQALVFVELDNKPRERRLAVHAWGEG